MQSLRRVGKGALRAVPTIFIRCLWWWARFALPTLRFFALNSFDNRRGAHAAADAQRHQRGRLVGALEFVEHGAEDHRAGSTQGMAERDGAAIDVDLGVVDVE